MFLKKRKKYISKKRKEREAYAQQHNQETYLILESQSPEWFLKKK
jgi:hypothetical protein